MCELEDAAWEALVHAAFYQYPLTLEELRHRLPRVTADAEDVARAVDALKSSGLVEEEGGLVFPAGRRGLGEVRRRRAEKSRSLMERARKAVELLAGLPWVEGIFLSGSNAFDNAADDDVDLFTVCRPGTEWLTLLSARLAERRAGVPGLLCANYILASDRLALPERTLFTAFQLVNLKTLFGHPLLERLRRENPWTSAFFPNARESRPGPFAAAPVRRAWPPWAVRLLSILAEAAFRPYLRLARGLRHNPPGVALERGRLKLHVHDHTLEKVALPRPLTSR